MMLKLLGALVLILSSCCETGYNKTKVSIDSNDLTRKNGITYYRGERFTGYVSEKYYYETPKSSTPYNNGVRNGAAKEWYSNNQLKSIRYFRHGKSIGAHKGYWDTGEKRFLYRYKHGAQHGTQIEWHENGNIARKNRMKNGQLSGIQKGWRVDGDLKFNFTYIDGKRYGFLGATLCVPTE